MLQLALIVHVLGATIWAGGHIVLSLTVLPRALKQRDPQIIRDFEAGYERLGIPALVAQVITGVWLAYRLVPDPAQWFGFDSFVATHIAVKLLLLAATLALAVDARLRIIPRLDARSLPSLAWHVVAVTVIAVLLVMLGVGLRTGGLL
jgi:putative copper export protein